MRNWMFLVLLPAITLAIPTNPGGKTLGDEHVKIPGIAGQKKKLERFEKQGSNPVKSMQNRVSQSNIQHCLNGGYPNPTNCQVCLCPTGFGGKICDQIAESTPLTNCGGKLTIEPGRMWKPLDSFEANSADLPENGIECVWWIKVANPNLRVYLNLRIRFLSPNYDTNENCEGHFVEIKHVKDLTQEGRKYCALNDVMISSWTNMIIVRYSRQKQFTPKSAEGTFTASYMGKSACISHPCQNMGKCIDIMDKYPGYSCNCPNKWHGYNCELPENRKASPTTPSSTRNTELCAGTGNPGGPNPIPGGPNPNPDGPNKNPDGTNPNPDGPNKNPVGGASKKDEIYEDSETPETTDPPEIAGGLIEQLSSRAIFNVIVALIIIGLLLLMLLLAGLLIFAVKRKKKDTTSIGAYASLQTPEISQNKSHFSNEQSNNSGEEKTTPLTSKTMTMLSKILPYGGRTTESHQEISRKETDRRLGDQPSGVHQQSRQISNAQTVKQSTVNKNPYSMTSKPVTSQSKRSIFKIPLTPAKSATDSKRLLKSSSTLGNSKTYVGDSSRTGMSVASKTARSLQSVTVKGTSNYSPTRVEFVNAYGIPISKTNTRH